MRKFTSERIDLFYTWIHRVISNARVQRWSYRGSLVFFIVFFAGFCSVIPIDSIVQASESSKSKTSNYALNTFVVVGALVLFGLVGLFITTTRIFLQRASLQDIPKYYIPLDDGDLPESCLKMIKENFVRCGKIKRLGMETPKDLKHPGMSSPESELLPPSLPFEDVVRAVGDKLKWTHTLIASEFKIPKNYSFREMVAYLEFKNIATDHSANKEYVELFERLRFSGDVIVEEDFIQFMELSIDFLKLTRNNIDRSNVSFRRQSILGNNSIMSYNHSVMDSLNYTNSVLDSARRQNYSNENLELMETQSPENHHHHSAPQNYTPSIRTSRSVNIHTPNRPIH